MNSPYHFVLEIRTMDGKVLLSTRLEPDWEPALQAARLAGLRHFGVWHEDGNETVAPVWHHGAGEPMVEGLRVEMWSGGQTWSMDFEIAEYFGEAVQVIVASQLAAGTLASAARFRYAVAAYPGSNRAAETRLRLNVVERPRPLEIRDRAFSTLAAGSVACGEVDPSDIEVILPEPLLEEVCALTRSAGARETGGILLGHLCRDDRHGDIGLEVTAQVPARHTVSEAEKLTFTSDTWTDVRNAVALRRSGELFCGWWHSHPAISFCAKCPIERQRSCQLATGFLSGDDKALHRSVFPSAFTQALVVTNSVNGLDMRLFGWRKGVISARGFRLNRHGSKAHLDVLASVRATPSRTESACADEDGTPLVQSVVAFER